MTVQALCGSGKRTFRTLQRGQGMTEYIIIVALIAIAAIAAFTFFGSTVRAQLAGISHELSGKSASGDISNAQKDANKVQNESTTPKNMKAYTNKAAGQ